MKKTVLLFLFSFKLFALDGANTLLKSIPTSQIQNNKTDSERSVYLQRPSDPFLSQVFTSWKTGKNLPYDVNLWLQTIVEGDFEKAAHLWSSIKQKIPFHFEAKSEIIYAFLLERLGLHHLFIDQYLSLKKRFQNHSAPLEMTLLEEEMNNINSQQKSVSFSSYFSSQKPFLTEGQVSYLGSLKGTQSSFLTDARAWSDFLSKKVQDLDLKSLPKHHPLLLPLARLKTLELSRKGDLEGAGLLLKNVVEPEIESLSKPEELAQHYLTLARLLYQAQALDAAIDYYQSIPSGSSFFLTAQTELMWALLRKGDRSQLRGQLRTLGDKALSNYFMPEVYLVRAISNLKLCLYESVEKDIKSFVDHNKIWAQKIEQALSDKEMANTPESTPYVDLLKEVNLALADEIHRLESLGQNSIRAALPAVGIQPHWEAGLKRLKFMKAAANKRLEQEKTNWWLSRRKILVDAIRKMHFVRVEFLSEVHRLGSKHLASTQESDSVRTTLSAKDNPGKIIFPFDGVFWPDEYFHLRSLAQDACMNFAKEK